MESKLNREALKEYSRHYGNALGKGFFDTKKSISGREILELSEIRQINLFVIYNLLSRWIEESKRMRSEYFDYSSPGVQKALSHFLNSLSQHIQINKEVFLPLLISAVEDTILLILSPYEFYCDLINRRKKRGIDVKEFRSLLKYVKINQPLFKLLIEKLDENNQGVITTDNALKILNEVFEKTSITPEDIDGYVTVLSKLSKLPLEVIYGSEIEDSRQIQQSEPDSQNQKIKTLNDQLTNDTNSMLLNEIKKKTRIGSIKNQLTINQKFMFINQLFDGNSDDFNKVMDFLENCSTQAEAMNFINSNYISKNNWKMDSHEVKEFIEVVALKYT